MGNIIAVIALLGAVAANAGECKDSNFDGIGYINYGDLDQDGRFVDIQSFDSPQPAGLFEAYFDYTPDVHCYDMRATYFTHKETSVKYVMFTTHDDYCDGGNTYGLVVNMKAYQKHQLKQAVVAEIGDSDFFCVE